MAYRALDLFCGGGGAALGMLEAGFDEVVGVDIEPHPNYPGVFIQGDIHDLPVRLEDFDFIWASPPCQRFSTGGYFKEGDKDADEKYPDLIPITRSLLEGHPYTCIENVPRAPIRCDLALNGPAMGLPFIQRRRHFELSFFMWQPHLPKTETGMTITVCKSRGARNKNQLKFWKSLGLGTSMSSQVRKHVMGIDYFHPMTDVEVGESVPPPYSKHIAEEALQRIKRDHG